MVLRSTVSMFGPLQPGWLSTARASFRNDARRTRPSGRVTAEQQAAPTDSADQLGLVLNSWLALAHAMHAVQAFLARRTLVALKKIKRLKIIPAIFICGFSGPRRIIQKAPQLANVEEAPAWVQKKICVALLGSSRCLQLRTWTWPFMAAAPAPQPSP